MALEARRQEAGIRMVARANVNRNNLLCVMLLELRRHFRTCARCRGAMDTRDYSLLCDYTQRRIIDIAMRWERSLSVRIQVRKDNSKLVFLCPDPNVHGAAYAAVAEPVIVTHVQDALF